MPSAARKKSPSAAPSRPHRLPRRHRCSPFLNRLFLPSHRTLDVPQESGVAELFTILPRQLLDFLHGAFEGELPRGAESRGTDQRLRLVARQTHVEDGDPETAEPPLYQPPEVLDDPLAVVFSTRRRGRQIVGGDATGLELLLDGDGRQSRLRFLSFSTIFRMAFPTLARNRKSIGPDTRSSKPVNRVPVSSFTAMSWIRS